MTKNKEFIQARIDSIVASSTIMVHDDDDDDDVEIRDRYQRTLMSGRKVPRYREHPSNTHIFQQVKKECINHRHTEPIFCEVCLHRYRRNEDSMVDFNSCHCISESDGSNISNNNTMNPNNRFGLSCAEQEYGTDERLASATSVVPKQKKRAPIPCNYEEDIHDNGHTSVWGSYFHKRTFKWGYADDHSLVKSSYGTGINGRIANDESNESTYDGSGAASTRKILEVIPKAGSINANSEKDKPNNAQSKLYGEASDQHKAFDKEKLTAAMKLQEESELGDEEVVLEVGECLAEPVIDVQLQAKTKKKKNLALVDGDNDIHEHKRKAFRRNALAIVAFLLVVVIICICIIFTIARPRKTPLG